MNKTFYILLFVIFGVAVRLSAQVNLVPNPSFEMYDTCPYRLSDPGGIYYAIPWFQPDTSNGNFINSSSSDYFNSCSTTWGVPSSWFGYQPARTGNAYAGIGVFGGVNNNLKEYLEVKLIQPLEANRNYCVEYYVSLTNLTGYYSLATDALHLAFSDSIICSNGYQPLHLNPDILNPAGQIVSDTASWVRIFGTYTAHGGEEYIIIGNFYDNADCLIDSTGSPAEDFAYYFVDDVSVSICTSEIKTPNIFTPNGDGVNDLFVADGSGMSSFTCQIYDRWGAEVSVFQKTDMGWDGKDKNGTNCTDGVYYYLITAKGYDEKEYQYKGFVQLLR